MRRALVFALLVASVPFAGTLQAQRAGGAVRGGGGIRPGFSTGLGGRPFRPGFSGFRSRNFRNNGLYYPIWYDDYDDYGEPYYGEEQQPPMPPVIVMQAAPPQQMAQEAPAANPKVIELPERAKSGAAAALQAAIFVLANGERFEAQRYMLTHDKLYATVDGQQRTIPLSMLNLNATIAADRERGIDLRIPADHNEISLSF